VHALALRAYDQMIGLELADVAVDGCLTKAPGGGECAGPSPVDRRKGGLKCSVATGDYGIPLGIAAAGANRHDSSLLAPPCRLPQPQLGGVLPQRRTLQPERCSMWYSPPHQPGPAGVTACPGFLLPGRAAALLP
jgi:hypothetical protein